MFSVARDGVPGPFTGIKPKARKQRSFDRLETAYGWGKANEVQRARRARHLIVRYKADAEDASQAVGECVDRCRSSRGNEYRTQLARASQRASPRPQQFCQRSPSARCLRHARVSACGSRSDTRCSRHGGRVHNGCRSHSACPFCGVTPRWPCPSHGLNKTSLPSTLPVLESTVQQAGKSPITDWK